MLLPLHKIAFTPSVKFQKIPPDYACSPLPKPKSAASLRNKEVVCVCVYVCVCVCVCVCVHLNLCSQNLYTLHTCVKDKKTERISLCLRLNIKYTDQAHIITYSYSWLFS